MRSTLTSKLTIAERFPMTGPNEPVDDDVVHLSAVVDRDANQAFPTEQMKAYKKALKESGRKPIRKVSKPIEQHFDDCGEDMTSLVGISSSYETYRDTVYDDFDLMGRRLPIPAHDHVFCSHEKTLTSQMS